MIIFKFNDFGVYQPNITHQIIRTTNVAYFKLIAAIWLLIFEVATVVVKDIIILNEHYTVHDKLGIQYF